MPYVAAAKRHLGGGPDSRSLAVQPNHDSRDSSQVLIRRIREPVVDCVGDDQGGVRLAPFEPRGSRRFLGE